MQMERVPCGETQVDLYSPFGPGEIWSTAAGFGYFDSNAGRNFVPTPTLSCAGGSCEEGFDPAELAALWSR